MSHASQWWLPNRTHTAGLPPFNTTDNTTAVVYNASTLPTCRTDHLGFMDNLAVFIVLPVVAMVLCGTAILWCRRKSYPDAQARNPAQLALQAVVAAAWLTTLLFSNDHIHIDWIQSTFDHCFLMEVVFSHIIGESLYASILLYRLLVITRYRYNTTIHFGHLSVLFPLLTGLATALVAYYYPGAVQHTGCSDVACQLDDTFAGAISAVYASHVILLFALCYSNKTMMKVYHNSTLLSFAIASLLLPTGLCAVITWLWGANDEAAQTAYTTSCALAVWILFLGQAGDVLLDILYCRGSNTALKRFIATADDASAHNPNNGTLTVRQLLSNPFTRHYFLSRVAKNGRRFTVELFRHVDDFVNTPTTTRAGLSNRRRLLREITTTYLNPRIDTDPFYRMANPFDGSYTMPFGTVLLENQSFFIHLGHAPRAPSHVHNGRLVPFCTAFLNDARWTLHNTVPWITYLCACLRPRQPTNRYAGFLPLADDWKLHEGFCTMPDALRKQRYTTGALLRQPVVAARYTLPSTDVRIPVSERLGIVSNGELTAFTEYTLRSVTKKLVAAVAAAVAAAEPEAAISSHVQALVRKLRNWTIYVFVVFEISPFIRDHMPALSKRLNQQVRIHKRAHTHLGHLGSYPDGTSLRTTTGEHPDDCVSACWGCICAPHPDTFSEFAHNSDSGKGSDSGGSDYDSYSDSGSGSDSDALPTTTGPKRHIELATLHAGDGTTPLTDSERFFRDRQRRAVAITTPLAGAQTLGLPIGAGVATRTPSGRLPSPAMQCDWDSAVKTVQSRTPMPEVWTTTDVLSPEFNATRFPQESTPPYLARPPPVDQSSWYTDPFTWQPARDREVKERECLWASCDRGEDMTTGIATAGSHRLHWARFKGRHQALTDVDLRAKPSHV